MNVARTLGQLPTTISYMLDLHSPEWATLGQAYGDASDVPGLIEQLRVSRAEAWDAAIGKLMSAILHQGEVYTATYAAMPHLLALAVEIGPSKESDDLLFSFAYAARGGPGPEVPEFLDEAWEDAQAEAHDLILERLIHGESSPDFAGLLMAGLLYLSGEWSWGTFVNEWLWGGSHETRCSYCGITREVFSHGGGPKQVGPNHSSCDIVLIPSSEHAIPPDTSMEFDDDIISGQIIGLAASSGHAFLEKQMRQLFGSFICQSCGEEVFLKPPTKAG